MENNKRVPKYLKLYKKMSKIIGTLLTITILLLVMMAVLLVTQILIHPSEIPNICGIKILQVMSGSMADVFNVGDIVIIKEVKQQEKLEIGDIITFKKNETIVTHRITNITKSYENLEFTTKGDNNNAQDPEKVKFQEIEGKYICKISIIGDLITFMKKPMGMALILILPMLAIIIIITKDIKRQKREAIRREKRLKHEFDKERKNKNENK